MYSFRAYEQFGIYISIVFHRNLDREPRWHFEIQNVEDTLHVSGVFGSFEVAEKEALKKAVDYL